MKRLGLTAGTLLVAVTLAGCATKHYGRQGNLTALESSAMNCHEIDLEIAKVDGFLNRVDKESSFDGRSVLSFLGDFGVGNVMEKKAAIKSANERRQSLEALRAAKRCGQETSSATP